MSGQRKSLRIELQKNQGSGTVVNAPRLRRSPVPYTKPSSAWEDGTLLQIFENARRTTKSALQSNRNEVLLRKYNNLSDWLKGNTDVQSEKYAEEAGKYAGMIELFERRERAEMATWVPGVTERQRRKHKEKRERELAERQAVERETERLMREVQEARERRDQEFRRRAAAARKANPRVVITSRRNGPRRA